MKTEIDIKHGPAIGLLMIAWCLLLFTLYLALNYKLDALPAYFYPCVLVGCFCAFCGFKLIKKPRGDGSHIDFGCERKRDENGWHYSIYASRRFRGRQHD
jgi:hypothetical protein